MANDKAIPYMILSGSAKDTKTLTLGDISEFIEFLRENSNTKHDALTLV